jgi:hypothetical protein
LALAAGLMGLTLGTWTVWSLYIRFKKRGGLRKNKAGLMTPSK